LALDPNSGLPLDPSTLQALQQQQLTRDVQDVGGNAATRLNIGSVQQATNTLFPNAEMVKAQKTQAALQGATVQQDPGEDNLDYSIRQLQAQRDAVAPIDPQSAAQMTTQLTKLAVMKQEQGRLQAQDARAQGNYDAESGKREVEKSTGSLAYVVTQDPKAELGYTSQAFDLSSPDGVSAFKAAAGKPGAQPMSADRAAQLFNSSNTADMKIAAQLAKAASAATGNLPAEAVPQIAVESVFDKSAMSRFKPEDRAQIALFKARNGITPLDELSAQTEIKALQAAATQAGRRDGNVTLLQQSLDRAGGQVLDSLKGVTRSDFTFLNKLVADSKSAFSDPGEARMAASLQTFVNDYARVIAGGTGQSTEGARKEAWETLSKSAGPSGLYAAVKQMAVVESQIFRQAGDSAIELMSRPSAYPTMLKIQKAAGLPLPSNADLSVTSPQQVAMPKASEMTATGAAPANTLPQGWTVVAH